jgi:hypothetical protein
MAVVGLWHGVGWGFVLWGVLHGCYLVAYRMWDAAKQKQASVAGPSRVSRFGWQAATLLAVVSAWVPFRANSLAQAGEMLRSMFFTFNPRISFSLNFYLVTLLVGAVCLVEPYARDWFVRLDSLAANRLRLAIANTYFVRPALYALGLLLFIVFDGRDVQFIYFQF